MQAPAGSAGAADDAGVLRVLTWNLFHGRSDPAAGRPLLHEFATALARWSWDVALLQEVPPWWPPLLAHACGAESRSVRTSRNALLPLRRAVAARRPDLLRSNGGGCNAILVRRPFRIEAHARRRLRLRPERRVAHAVRLGAHDDGHVFAGAWIGNVHGQLGRWSVAGDAADGPGGTARRGRGPTEITGRPGADLALSVDRMEAWAAGAATFPGGAADVGAGKGDGRSPDAGGAGSTGAGGPLVLGGDLNLPAGDLDAALPADWSVLASAGPDHLAGRGFVRVAPAAAPDRGDLSDHAPLLVAVRPA